MSEPRILMTVPYDGHPTSEVCPACQQTPTCTNCGADTFACTACGAEVER